MKNGPARASVVVLQITATRHERATDEATTGVAPDGLLHDCKPCYFDAGLQDAVGAVGTLMVAATPARPENKASGECDFSRF
jgi:hypothetical protein